MKQNYIFDGFVEAIDIIRWFWNLPFYCVKLFLLYKVKLTLPLYEYEKYSCFYVHTHDWRRCFSKYAGFSTLCSEDMMGKFAGLKEKTTTYVYYLKPELFIIILKLSRRAQLFPK